MLLKRNRQYNNGKHCKLNLRGDGADDGTVITDSSPFNKTVTRTGAVTKTGIKKFGTASIYFDGTNDYLSLADSADWAFGCGDITLEFNIYYISLIGSQGWIAQLSNEPTGNKSFVLFHGVPGGVIKYRFIYTTDGNTNISIDTGTLTPSINQFYHIACSRKSGVFNMYIDGHNVKNYNIGSDSLYDSTVELSIGAFKDSAGAYYSFYAGYMDSLQIIKGRALYNRNFKSPTRAA